MANCKVNKEIKTKKEILLTNIDIIDKLKEDYGIALIVIKSLSPTDKDAVCEFVSEDDVVLTVKNIAIISEKQHFNDITSIPNNPLFTVPEGYTDSKFELTFLDKSNFEATIKKSDILLYQILTDSNLIQQYIKNRG
jgi:hypothetical protein